MKISTRGRYALRLMMDLAEHGGPVPIREAAERLGVSAKYLEQIVPLLVKDGLLQSIRGNSGGYRLTKDPEDCTAGEILRAAEGSLAPIACLEGENDCPRSLSCGTLPFWSGLGRVIDAYVDSFTLRDIMEQSRRLGRGAAEAGEETEHETV